MTSAIPQWLAERVDDIIGVALKSGAIVSAWEQIKELLASNSLAWTQQIPPEFVGTHKSNRSGEGVGAIQSHNHGYEICQQGWSWHKAADAVAVECINDAEQVEFNVKMVALSADMFPAFVMIKVLSISASHTNAFLRSAKSNCKSGCPQLADANGRLNFDEICLNRPGLKDAITHGLKWFVLSHAAVSQWPRLIDMVQKSMNTTAREYQSEVQVMLDMMHQAHANVAWVDIERAAKFSNPPCKAWVSSLAAYVRDHCGAGELLEDLNLFSRSMQGLKDQTAAGSNKTLGSEFWSKLNNVKWGHGKKMPWLMNAVIKANLASPPNKVVDGFCKLVEGRHVGLLMAKANIKTCEEAEALMTDARAVVKQIGLSEVEQALALGKLDVRCVWHIFKLGKAGEGRNFDRIHDIAQALELSMWCSYCALHVMLEHLILFRWSGCCSILHGVCASRTQSWHEVHEYMCMSGVDRRDQETYGLEPV